MKRGLTVGDVGRSSRKQWFWMLKNMHLVFSRLENRSCKKHLAIDGLDAAAAECKWEMLADQPGNKDAA